MAESKGPLPDYMQKAFQGKRSVIIHGIEYKSADEVPDKWRTPTRDAWLAARELGSYVPGENEPFSPVLPEKGD